MPFCNICCDVVGQRTRPTFLLATQRTRALIQLLLRWWIRILSQLQLVVAAKIGGKRGRRELQKYEHCGSSPTRRSKIQSLFPAFKLIYFIARERTYCNLSSNPYVLRLDRNCFRKHWTRAKLVRHTQNWLQHSNEERTGSHRNNAHNSSAKGHLHDRLSVSMVGDKPPSRSMVLNAF